MPIKKDLPPLYVFQWISDLGGADTRLKELLILLAKDFAITCIPNDISRLNEKQNTDFLDHLGIKYCMPNNLPKRLSGFAYSNCNFRLFSEKERIQFIRASGLKFVWSNDMMWTKPEELAAIKEGLVDCVLFTSHFHESIIGKDILKANPDQKTAILENYFDSASWPYIERPEKELVTCGKVSRADFLKFSENFPVFYESAANNLPIDFKIMGWNNELERKYRWFNFSERWEFLPTNAIKAQDFLGGLDIFLYDCNFKFIENQSRAIIESQLTGCPIIAPNKWNFPNMIWNQRTGILWNDLIELQAGLKEIIDYRARKKMGKLASEMTREIWCDAPLALRKWSALLESLK